MASNSNIAQTRPLIVSVRSSEGLFLLSPNQTDYSQLSKYNNFQDDSRSCRISTFDPTGKYFAYCNNTQKTKNKLFKIQSFGLFLGRLGDILWFSSFIIGLTKTLNQIKIIKTNSKVTKDGQKEVSNLNVYESQSGKLIKSIVHKKQFAKFVDWSSDESIFAIQSNSDVLFFERANPDVIVDKIRIENLSSFSMSSVSKCVAIHVSGKKSEPSLVRLYKYPDLSNAIANKSFFNAEKVEFKWNKTGNNLLLLCTTETSQNSYYGDSTLHQIGTNGESQLVQLSKKGPIYALEWNPARDEFVVVYGNMPAKATLYNGKCEAIFDFGTGPRNECFYNQHGNLLCLAGFGNLRGRIEVWNVASASKVPQELSSFQADDTTYFEWSPDGEHLLTATTAPRLRVSNGYKIWNYSGDNLFKYQMPGNNELWQVQWQPGQYPQRPIVKRAVADVVKEETKAYVPPHLRGTNKVAQFKTKLHEDDEKPDKALKIKPTEKAPGEDLEKNVKNLRKKLSQIQDLKKKQTSGTKLESNQIEKLKSENEIIAELKKLGAL